MSTWLTVVLEGGGEEKTGGVLSGEERTGGLLMSRGGRKKNCGRAAGKTGGVLMDGRNTDVDMRVYKVTRDMSNPSEPRRCRPHGSKFGPTLASFSYM